MATHDYVLDNASGAAFRTDLNNALAAIVSNNSNSSSPATTYAYQWWADTSAGVLKIRNSANNAWIELFQLDGTLTLEDGAVGTPALAFRDDLNTGIYSSAADTFNVATAGVERMELGATTIFNEDGADVDFRIEGDGDQNLFYVNAGDDNVLIGSNSGDSNYKLHIKSSTFGLLKLETQLTGADAAYLEFYHNTSSPADNDQIGIIQFKGKNSNNDDHTYAYMMVRSTDVTDGSEDGELQVVTHNDGVAGARLTVGNDGAVKANTGNFVVGTTGRGVQFDTADSGSDQLLDDYEEGTWVPTFQNVNAPTYTSRAGKYTKIGRFVYLTGELFVASGLDTSDASAIAIGALPFTPAATHNAALFEFGSDVSLISQSGLEGFTNVNMTTSLAALLRGSANLAYSQCNTSGNLKFALTYETA
tara:strand:+ start:1235 stop:2491 length:1257 start_codon:yes stop_codon:yes gene_type:complete